MFDVRPRKRYSVQAQFEGVTVGYQSHKVIENQIMAALFIIILLILRDETCGITALSDYSFGPYVTTIARWGAGYQHGPSLQMCFLLLCSAPPDIRRRSAILIRPGEAIPFGRPYRTHLNGPRKLLTARKRVGPLPAHRLASRHASPRSSDHHSSSSSSSSDSLPVHSLGLDASDQAHSGSSTRDEDAEVVYIETGVDMELGIGDGDDVRDHVEIDLRGVRDDTEEYEADAKPAGEDSSDSSGTRDGIVRSVEDMPVDLDDVVRDFYHHMSEVRVDRIVEIETAQRRLEADQLIASGDRARMAEMIYSLRLENLKVRAMLDIKRDRVNSFRLYMSLSQEEFCQIRRDRDDARGRLRRYMEQEWEMQWKMVIGNGNGNDNGMAIGWVAHNVPYQDFVKCQPLSFKGTEGVVGLIRWSEKMETVFHISNCPERYQVKYATCTLLDSALTWWNSHKRTIGTDAAYALSWRES
ncbi:hypothetical protein Tco_1546881 [Tanacetum coccineum]